MASIDEGQQPRLGGKVIDVGKLERIRYHKDRQEIFWRSVTSANSSAEFDDGMVIFDREVCFLAKVLTSTFSKSLGLSLGSIFDDLT